MHLYLTLVQRWRWRRGAPDAEGVLRKVADDRLVLATSGGSDWVCPSTTAVAVPGGYRLDGRKQFCTQAPVAWVISTSATLGEPGPDAVVLHAGVPLSAPGVSIVETWDTLGMRGTASHDVVFDGVFLPAEKVVGQRPYGVLTGPLLAAAIHFAPVAGAAYLGWRGVPAPRRCGWRGVAASPGRRRSARSARCGRGCRWRAGRCRAPSPSTGDDPALDEATLATVMTGEAARRRGGAGRRRHRAGGRGRGGVLPALTAGAGLPRRARRPVPPADPRGDAHAARRARPAKVTTCSRSVRAGAA